jgi:hypothetical protein
MATDIVGSLFGVTPEVLQQRQMEMADRQAMEYAQLSPLQRASYGLARGGYQLAGALGGQDPQLRMISNRNAIARQIDPTNLESMQMGIQALQQAGDSVGAMQLAQVLRQAESEAAQRFQREAAGEASLATARRERVQATPREIQLARELASQRGAPGTPEYQEAYNAELTRLTTTGESATPEMRNAAALASRKGPPGSPEYNAEYQAQLSRLTTKEEGREPTSTELTNARALAALAGPVGSAEYNAELRTQLNRLTTKPEREGALPASLQLADAISSAQAKVDELESQPESPERDRALAVAKRRVENLERQAPQPRGQSPSPALQLANAIATTETEIATIESQPESPERDAQLAAAKRKLAALERQSPQPRTPAQSPALQLATEISNQQAVVDALQNVPASAERDAALRRAVTQLNALQRQLPEPREPQKPEIARLQELRDSYPVGSKERKEVQNRIDALGKGGGVSVTNVLPRQEAGVNKNKVELAGQVESNAINATDRIALARNLRTFLPQAFTGLGSDVKLEASRFAAALGIPVTGTTESQIIDQILGQMTIGAAGQLKGALSDKDREFLKQTIGTRGLTRSALEFVSQRIEREARIDERLNEAVQAWQTSGKSLNDFNFVTQRSEAARQIDADIKRLEELRRKQKGG